jgi:hypothetical protein
MVFQIVFLQNKQSRLDALIRYNNNIFLLGLSKNKKTIIRNDKEKRIMDDNIRSHFKTFFSLLLSFCPRWAG